MNRTSLLLLLLGTSLLAADDAKLLGSLKYRSIGPFRGGRVIAVTGVTSQPNTYYFGGTGGGVYKTTDAGANWEPMTDGQLKTGTVGAIAVSESDPNILYVGMGEGCIRGNASHGDGVYKSMDGGKTWKNVGLIETRQIGRVRIHPRNPDIVWVAALGHMSGANEERGVFKTVDGGKTWKRTLFKSNKAGAIDLAIDPTNPNVMFAAVWQVVRTPYSLESGGADSGLWKSTDGGDTWTDISRAAGLPAKGLLGRIGVTVSPVNPDRIWAIVEHDEGGVFRSDNGGKNWTKVNESRNLRQRAWYYTHIFADPKSANTVYVLNTGVYRSDDGGRTYATIAVPHGDNHDLWIASNDPSRMIEGNDGGAVVSNNGGRSWSTNMNQPTAQFYRVFADGDFPYNVYGAQQDNSTVRTASRGNSGSITEREWFDAGGGESGWMAPDPKDSNIVYAGSYGGLLTRYDHKTGQLRNINVWPDNPMGAGAEAMRYRFQWNFPLLFSPHDPKLLYAGGNRLFKSSNEGQSWEAISPDLTRDDKIRQGSSGGPITKDNTGVEYYCTIFTVDESHVTKGLIWTGSDDGLVYVTRDSGKKWTNVTPKDMPEWIQINSIEASPHDPAKAYFAGTMYKSDDHRPYLYRTTDYGATWKKIVTGIPDTAFTRVIREDPNKKGLLFAGTETGIYMSYDDGDTWQNFQLNLPVVPIADLAFQKRENDLVISTQGRAFWIFDDMPILQQMADSVRGEAVHLFKPKETYRYAGGGFGGGGIGRSRQVGQNPPGGVVVYYMLKDKPTGEVTLEFMDSAGKLVKKFSSVEDKKAVAAERRRPSDDDDEEGFGPPAGPMRAPANAGLNRFVWDMRYADTSSFPGMIYWAASSRGPVIVPGDYQVKLTANGQSFTQAVKVKKDPRITSSMEDLNRQLSLSLQLRDKVTQVNDAVIKIRDTRKQIDDYVARVADQKEAAKAVDAGKALSKKLFEIENELYQTKNQSSQDPLNYPIKLNNKIAAVMGVVQMSDTAPTKQASEVFEDLATKANAQLKALDSAMKGDLVNFNKLAKDADVPVVVAK